jgi:carbonic anhydrase/acetyltransferase-like protein (isoleucine patch superfamily)
VASRTVVDSVSLVSGPPADLDALQGQLAALRKRHPGVTFARYLDQVPAIDPSAFVAPGAAIIGDVRLGPSTSVWYQCVLRGDVNRIEVGARSNLQDGTVVHLGDDDPTVVGEDVVVGHRAVIHGCTIGDGTLVGICATILDGATIGHGSIVGAGAVVTAGTVVPPHSLVLGMPGRVVKTLDPADEAFHRRLAGKYTRLAHNYLHG